MVAADLVAVLQAVDLAVADSVADSAVADLVAAEVAVVGSCEFKIQTMLAKAQRRKDTFTIKNLDFYNNH